MVGGASPYCYCLEATAAAAKFAQMKGHRRATAVATAAPSSFGASAATAAAGGGGGGLFGGAEKASRYVALEGKLQAARQRREAALYVREARSRAANMRQAEASRAALQGRWREEAARAKRAFALKQSSDEQLALRKVSETWKVNAMTCCVRKPLSSH